MDIVIKRKFKQNYKTGYPLLFKEALLENNKLNEGDVVRLVDDKGKYLATAYIGNQNKGIGWVLSLDRDEKINYAFFYNRIKKAIDCRAKFYSSDKTNCFRVFNGEGDGVGGFTIDYYAGYYMFNWYNKGIYSFRKRIMDAFMNLIPFEGIYEKIRFDDDNLEKEAFAYGKQAEMPLIVKENDIYYSLDFHSGGMVGLFLDQRDIRKKLRLKYSSGKKLLNMFSYTGGFSVVAAVGGAVQTTSVDTAKRSLSWTEENLYLNNLELMSNSIVIEDVFKYFDIAYNNGTKFDIVVLDPPSYSKTKAKIFSVEKNYRELIYKSIKILSKNGIIVASTNNSAFSRDEFLEQIKAGCKQANKKFDVIEEFRLPEDFRVNKKYDGSNYLKVFFIRIK